MRCMLAWAQVSKDTKMMMIRNENEWMKKYIYKRNQILMHYTTYMCETAKFHENKEPANDDRFVTTSFRNENLLLWTATRKYVLQRINAKQIVENTWWYFVSVNKLAAIGFEIVHTISYTRNTREKKYTTTATTIRRDCSRNFVRNACAILDLGFIDAVYFSNCSVWQILKIEFFFCLFRVFDVAFMHRQFSPIILRRVLQTSILHTTHTLSIGKRRTVHFLTIYLIIQWFFLKHGTKEATFGFEKFNIFIGCANSWA